MTTLPSYWSGVQVGRFSTASMKAPAVGDFQALAVAYVSRVAPHLFDAIGPDQPETCSGARGDRHGRKKGIVCFYTAEDVSDKDGLYRCWIGLNLNNGDTIGTISC